MQTFQCSAILFDLDGVLVNSIASVERQWRKFAERHRLDPALVIHTAHGHRTEETVRLLLPTVDFAAEAAIVEENEINDTDGLIATEGALALMNSIPRQRWAVVTSGTRRLATRRLQAAGLPLPDEMVPADEVSHGKPHPEPYLKGAQKLGFAPEECLVLEDARSGIRSARAAGMRVIGVPGTYLPEELGEADLLIRSLADLRVRENGTNLQLELVRPFNS